jgi:hypothetical protein
MGTPTYTQIGFAAHVDGLADLTRDLWPADEVTVGRHR